MLELDVNDTLALSNTINFQPISIKKVRIRQSKQYYEIEWKKTELPSIENIEDQIANISIMDAETIVAGGGDDDDDEEKLITIEPANLFRHAYPDIVNAFETPLSKPRKIKKITAVNNENRPITKRKKIKQPSTAIAASTSMSLDLLSMIEHETSEIPVPKPKSSKFNHRPTMAALSTSINLDVLGALQKSIGNFSTLRKAKSRPIKHHTQSDMVIHSKIMIKGKFICLIYVFVAQKPVTLLNTSLSLDVLDIILREKQQLNDNDCEITDVFINKPSRQKRKLHNNMILWSSSDKSDNDDDDKDVLPLPLWDRIRQRTAI